MSKSDKGRETIKQILTLLEGRHDPFDSAYVAMSTSLIIAKAVIGLRTKDCRKLFDAAMHDINASIKQQQENK